ncbi:MAG TPA: lamin tail domain-containing protein, partial [Candidatus Acidoferrum sp.]|nr:lamin tail domain-containing protein [Candidatus Acidoferrum sp.]
MKRLLTSCLLALLVSQPVFAALPTITIAVGSSTSAEGTTNFFRFVSDVAVAQNLTIKFSIAEAAQIAGFVTSTGLAPRQVTIPVGKSSSTAYVHVVNDLINTGQKTLTVQLLANASYTLGSPNSAAITIPDNDSAPAPAPTDWPEVFNPWKVQRLDLSITNSTWAAFVASGFSTNMGVGFRHDDGTYFKIKVEPKNNNIAVGEKKSMKFDLNEFGGPAWRSLQQLNLHVGEDTSLLYEGAAWYLHQLAAGINGNTPGFCSFVELYINNVLQGTYLSVEQRDDNFVKNRNINRKNSTYVYKWPPQDGPTQVYPDGQPPSPVAAALGDTGAHPSIANWEKYFEVEAVLTLAGVDAFTGNPDGMFAGGGSSSLNNLYRIDFYYTNAAANTTRARKSFCTPRDLDLFSFAPCQSATAPFRTFGTIKMAQRQREIMKSMFENQLSPANVKDMLYRMQFLLMDRLLADPNSGVLDACDDLEDATLEDPAVQFNHIRTWVATRFNTVNAQLASQLAYLPSKPGVYASAGLVMISNPNSNSEIWYTLDGTDPWVHDGSTRGQSVMGSGTSFSLGMTRHVFARIRQGSAWSAPVRVTFAVPSSAAALQITEVKYRPDAPSGPEATAGYDRDDFEYIKLRNTGSGLIDLSDHYMEGVVYTFPPGTQIGPSKDFIIVRNPRAYEMRHGTNFQAVYWDGKLNDTGERVAVYAPNGTTIVAVDYPGLSALKFTEIHYRPETSEDYEFVELKNAGTESLNVSGFKLAQGIAVTLPANTTMAAGTFLVIAGQRTSFDARYPGVPRVDVAFSGHLSDSGETVELEDAESGTITAVTYGTTLPWPTWAYSFGHSLVNTNTAGDPNTAQNWRASANVHGSPGATDPAPPLASYTLQTAIPPTSDPNYTPVAALAVDEVGVAAGYGVHSGFEFAFTWDTVEGGGVASRAWTSNPNCPFLYNPLNPYPWTSRGNSISDGLMVGYIGYDASSVPTAAIWQNGPTPVNGCDAWDEYYSEVKCYVANGYEGRLVGYSDGSPGFGGGIARRGDIYGWNETLAGFQFSTWSVANGVNQAGAAVG